MDCPLLAQTTLLSINAYHKDCVQMHVSNMIFVCSACNPIGKADLLHVDWSSSIWAALKYACICKPPTTLSMVEGHLHCLAVGDGQWTPPLRIHWIVSSCTSDLAAWDLQIFILPGLARMLVQSDSLTCNVVGLNQPDIFKAQLLV